MFQLRKYGVLIFGQPVIRARIQSELFIDARQSDEFFS